MAEEIQKKKVIRIKCSRDIETSCEPWNYGVGTPTLYFGFCGKDLIVDDKIRYKLQITQLHKCREILATHVHGQILKQDKLTHEVDTDAFRIIMAVDTYGALSLEEVRNRLFSAKRIMNLMENYAGWENSTISTVIHTGVTNKNKNFGSFLFTGPKEYIRYPQMLSLVTLVFRAAFNGLVFEKESIDEFINSVLSTKTDGGYVWETKVNRKPLITDINYLKEVLPYLKRLISAFYKVFEGDYEKYYPKDNNKFIGYGGINSLIRCCTGDVPLHKRLHHHVFNADEKL